MKLVRAILVVCLCIPAAFGQKKDQMMELQRDVALLQESIKSLQSMLGDKLAELKVISQQALDAANKANTGVAVMESGIRDRLSQQEKTVAGPVATLNTKLDQMASEFQGLKETVADMSARMGKLQAQVVDLGNQIKVMATPPAPPPNASGAPSNTPPPGMTATGLYENARRDQLAGNWDLAIQQYTDYLRYYSNTDLAPNAQYQIGEVFYGKGDYESALQVFDTVVEKFPDGSKTLDAYYMKGMTLEKIQQPTKAAQEYRALIKLTPSSEQASKAKARLKALGLPYPTAAPAKPVSNKKRR
jgi:tol-pal system protein YbgF